MSKKTTPYPHLKLFRHLNKYLQEHPHQGVHLRYADESAFSCSQCAQCCERPWGVYVSEAYFQKHAPTISEVLKQPSSELFQILPDTHEHYALLKKQDHSHRCIMLGEDNLCRIHTLISANAKPSTCTDYPRMTSQVDSGHYRASYMVQSCTTVARQSPQDWQIQYAFHPLNPTSPPPLFALNARGIGLEQPAFLLLIGSALDTLMHAPELAGVFDFLLQTLKRLSYLKGEVLKQEDVEPYLFEGVLGSDVQTLDATGYLRLMKALCEQLLPQSSFSGFVAWLQKITPQELILLSLSDDDQQVLLRYQKQYFQRAFIMQTYVQHGYANMLQQLYLWCNFGFLQQLLSIYYYRSSQSPTLTLEHLAQATNIMHALLAQNPRNAKHWGVSQWPDEICFIKIYQLIRALISTQPLSQSR